MSPSDVGMLPALPSIMFLVNGCITRRPRRCHPGHAAGPSWRPLKTGRASERWCCGAHPAVGLPWRTEAESSRYSAYSSHSAFWRFRHLPYLPMTEPNDIGLQQSVPLKIGQRLEKYAGAMEHGHSDRREAGACLRKSGAPDALQAAQRSCRNKAVPITNAELIRCCCCARNSSPARCGPSPYGQT